MININNCHTVGAHIHIITDEHLNFYALNAHIHAHMHILIMHT